MLTCSNQRMNKVVYVYMVSMAFATGMDFSARFQDSVTVRGLHFVRHMGSKLRPFIRKHRVYQ